MSVWLACPSKRPPAEAEACFAKWRARGYKIAIWRDEPWELDLMRCDLPAISLSYPGYSAAVNYLVSAILMVDPTAEWIVAAADDIEPDTNHTAEEIALECRLHFYRDELGSRDARLEMETFGVMQPTGDRDFGDAQGPYIDRVAGSAWLGREFCKRINQGRGPLWPEYFHMGEDEELQAVAEKYGVFWQRPDLTHYHAHWGRPREGEKMGQASRMPEFLREANSPEHWAKYKKLFAERKAAGFPGSEPL